MIDDDRVERFCVQFQPLVDENHDDDDDDHEDDTSKRVRINWVWEREKNAAMILKRRRIKELNDYYVHLMHKCQVSFIPRCVRACARECVCVCGCMNACGKKAVFFYPQSNKIK